MKLTTTFNRLKLKGACGQAVGSGRGYDKLSTYLGGADNYGKDVEINILTILDSNGLDDALWCLRATVQDDEVTKRLIACDFAESVLDIFESCCPGDNRPRRAIEVARGFANGMVSAENMALARDASAASAYAYAAYASAYASAAYAYASAYASTSRKRHKEKLAEILRTHLGGDE